MLPSHRGISICRAVGFRSCGKVDIMGRVLKYPADCLANIPCPLLTRFCECVQVGGLGNLFVCIASPLGHSMCRVVVSDSCAKVDPVDRAFKYPTNGLLDGPSAFLVGFVTYNRLEVWVVSPCVYETHWG